MNSENISNIDKIKKTNSKVLFENLKSNVILKRIFNNIKKIILLK